MDEFKRVVVYTPATEKIDLSSPTSGPQRTYCTASAAGNHWTPDSHAYRGPEGYLGNAGFIYGVLLTDPKLQVDMLQHPVTEAHARETSLVTYVLWGGSMMPQLAHLPLQGWQACSAWGGLPSRGGPWGRSKWDYSWKVCTWRIGIIYADKSVHAERRDQTKFRHSLTMGLWDKLHPEEVSGAMSAEAASLRLIGGSHSYASSIANLVNSSRQPGQNIWQQECYLSRGFKRRDSCWRFRQQQV